MASLATAPPAKKAKPDDEMDADAAEPAFTTDRSIAAFVPGEILKFADGGRAATVLGTLASESTGSSAAIVKIEQKAALATPESLMANLCRLNTTLNNHSGAEYSFYDAELAPDTSAAVSDTSDASGSYSVEVIWPADDAQVQRNRPAEFVLVDEDPETYHSVVDAFAEVQAGKAAWIDKVCSLAKERERCLYCDDQFIVNADTKWTTHGPFPASDLEDTDPEAFVAARKVWHGAPWTRELYLLAISKDASMRSLRDLRGEAGAALCDAMARELKAAAWRVYGVPASKVRVFFHYHPQFYRLHAHCNRIEWVNPGCEAERAHLLSSVAQNLRLSEGYYAEQATLSYKVRVGEKLHGILGKAGKLLE